MRLRPLLATLIAAVSFAAPPAFSHPGGHDAAADQSVLSHLLTDPYHLLIFGTLATLSLASVLACLERPRRRIEK